MGTKWSQSTSSSDTSIDQQDDEPPDPPLESGVAITLLDATNIPTTTNTNNNTNTNINTTIPINNTTCTSSSSPVKQYMIVRVSSSFSNNVYCKPVKYVVREGGAVEWLIPKRRFFFVCRPPVEGDIKVQLLQSSLPPLPAVPASGRRVTSSPAPAIAITTASAFVSDDLVSLEKGKLLYTLTVPVSSDSLKANKHVDQWMTVGEGSVDDTSFRVRLSLDYTHRPSRVLKAGQSISDKYAIEEVLGSGQYVVKRATHRATQQPCAIKFISKHAHTAAVGHRHVIEREIDTLRALDHPGIVRMVEAVEGPDTVHLVMELLQGTDLYNVVSALGRVRHEVAGGLVAQLLGALNYLHQQGIVHHDVKMENIVIDYRNNTLKLTDFGSAKTIKSTALPGGTIKYMAPELLRSMRGAAAVSSGAGGAAVGGCGVNGGGKKGSVGGGAVRCDSSVDIWSVGVVVYTMLSGYNPFEYNSKANENVINRIVSGKFDFPSPAWDGVPAECKDFVRRCLVVDPKQRPTAALLLKHPWMVAAMTATAQDHPQQPTSSVFTREDAQKIESESKEREESRSNSMRSLLELFGSSASCVPTRS